MAKKATKPAWMILTPDEAGKRWKKMDGGRMFTHGCKGDFSRETHDEAYARFLTWRKASSSDEFYEANGKLWPRSPMYVEQSRLMAEEMEVIRQHRETKATAGANIGELAEIALADMRGRVGRGELKASSYGSSKADIDYIARWLGEKSTPASINETTVKRFFSHLGEQTNKNKMSVESARDRFQIFKRFTRSLWEDGYIPELPRNLDSSRFKFKRTIKEPATMPINELHALLGREDASERMKLYLLLMLNCGMYQSDIADMRPEQIDWSEGVITRKRTKTVDCENAPTVAYPLWPETFALLKKHTRPQGYEVKVKLPNGEVKKEKRALVNENGGLLVRECVRPDGMVQHVDNIRTAYQNRMAKALGIKTNLKTLRKTTATILGQSPKHRHLATLFLGHAPRSVADKHYVGSADASLLSEALEHVRAVLKLETLAL